ncbi:MAG: diguanylate cyclase domain-containing protein [Roseateles sp.]
MQKHLPPPYPLPPVAAVLAEALPPPCGEQVAGGGQRQAAQAELPRVQGLSQFAVLLERQLGECRRHGLRAAVLLLEVELAGAPASAAAADGPGGPGAQGRAQDALLQALGTRLRARVRGSDVVARVGERQFGVVLVDAGRDEAETVRARLHKALCGPYGVETQRLYALLRMGRAVYRESGRSAMELLQVAEQGLHGGPTGPAPALLPAGAPLSLVRS